MMNLLINGNRGRGRPKKTWADCVKEDEKKWRMAETDPSDRDLWRKALFENATNRGTLLDGDLKHVK